MRVLVDLSNLGHIAWAKAHNASPGSIETYSLEEIFLSTLTKKLKSLENLILSRGFIDLEFIFVRDEPSVRKLSLYPAYKGTRNHTRSVDIPFLKAAQLLKSDGYGKVCVSSGNEADDTIATLCKEGECIIISNDKDLWQLLEYNRVWSLNPITKEFVGIGHIRKSFKLDEPRHIPLFKALWGDFSDNVINAVPRMQKRLLPIIRQTDGSLEDFLTKVELNKLKLTQRCLDLLAAGDKRLRLNWLLVKLDTDCEITWE